MKAKTRVKIILIGGTTLSANERIKKAINFLKEKNEDIPTNLAEAKKEIEIFYFEQIKILKNLLKDKTNKEAIETVFNDVAVLTEVIKQLSF